MYCVRKVTDDLYWVGANDHRLHLFENIHPIPRGVSYNAYLLLDEQSVLFDTVDWSAYRQLQDNLDHLLGDKPLDWLVVNHMEPDHGASVEQILRRYPFAHKILKKLARAGFVEVARGAEGGCRLSAELNRVTLYDLMTAMGEDSRLSSCMDPTYSCPWRASHGGCTVHCHLTGIQEKLNAELKAHTLEDILGPAD